MKSFKEYLYEEWVTAKKELSIYKNPSAIEMGKATKEGNGDVSLGIGYLRFLIDLRKKCIYVANSNLLHWDFFKILPEYKNNPNINWRTILTGHGKYSGGKITDVDSDIYNYKGGPVSNFKREYLKQDFSFADKYFDVPVKEIVKRFFGNK